LFLAKEVEPMGSESVHRHFTKGEAEALVGKTFENMVALPDVPQGAHGLVIATAHQNRNWMVVIQWERSQRRRKGQELYRWFTKNELGRSLREV
jgi:hypothetical protein